MKVCLRVFVGFEFYPIFFVAFVALFFPSTDKTET